MHRKTLIRLARLMIILSPLVLLAAGPPARLAQKQIQKKTDAVSFDKTVLPFLNENCSYCHNSKKQSGGLNLETFNTVDSLSTQRETWEHVLQKLQTGEMPPKGAPRPNDAESKSVIKFIETEFDRADRLAKPDPGRVTARRLNRAEYNNTVRDLLGVDLRIADNFPQDDSGYGFDNIGDVLSISPILMEKYLSAADTIARTAVFGPEKIKPTLVRFQPQGRKISNSNKPLFDYDQTGLSLPNAVHLTHRFPIDAEYSFRAMLAGVRPLGSEPLKLALWVDGTQTQVVSFDPEGLASFSDDRQDLGSQRQDFKARVSAGDHWIAISILNLYEGLPPSYNGPNPSKRPSPLPPEFKPPPGATPDRIERMKKAFEARRAVVVTVSDARINSVEIAGPYSEAKGPSIESLKKIYVCGQPGVKPAPQCIKQIVTNLARRAYRRPVSPQESARLVNLIDDAQRQGDSFEEGLSVAIQAMLVSPHFLFRIEKDRSAVKATGADDVYPISNHELASRLSYFIWSSMPDDELMRFADQGTLRRPAVLAGQIQRMLKDPKSIALVENFGGQWLELRKLESVTPDRQRFPEYDEYLRMSIRKETELFFDNIVREDRSILDFINGDYSFLNERLAKFYKIPGVKGAEFRKVPLGSNTVRGGVLTQASVLTVSSYSTRTSPVLRGKWILENILNAPPPPAPPGVPNLDEEKIGSAASLRQQLEEHRKNPTCASCHSRMDPLGFGLENFDAIGGWRTQDGKFPIDSSGTLPDGRKFSGPQELRAILMADRDAFAQCLTEKLLTYALGRGLERYDRPVIKNIARNVAAEDYRFSSLVREIVKSLPFQMRKTVSSSQIPVSSSP